MKKEVRMKKDINPSAVINGFCYAYLSALVERAQNLLSVGHMFIIEPKSPQEADNSSQVYGRVSEFGYVILSAISGQLGDAIAPPYDRVPWGEVEEFLSIAEDYLHIFEDYV